MTTADAPGTTTGTGSASTRSPGATTGDDARLPVRMLHDRILVRAEADSERRSGSGIVIPATATMGRRLGWAEVVAVGQHVRQVEVGDRVLYDPEDKAEVELHGAAYVVMRERDLHAVAAPRVPDGGTGLYL